ncbi:sensor histidine kinase [Candidatus Oscillochloris fontis]|uniref:sensor histidine kinase n=1 Tax=Candidatus Oscillochloris fontis TaxID=2496868 RepID=UPI001375AD31|nr:histidine kinase [Candidatus Oscillochloris fontis]
MIRTTIERLTPYPLALQGVVALVLIMTPLSGLSLPHVGSSHYWAMCLLVALHLLATLTLPARRMPRWGQMFYLSLQVGGTALAQMLFPTPLFDYVYLVIVLQALVLFTPWLALIFALGVWAVWSGGVMMATASALAWVQSNLTLAFPATCAIIAATIYLRQHRRSEQAQQMLQQMQQRYDSLSTALREMQQIVALEERQRLAQMITSEVQAALARTEQSIATTLGQAQHNLAWLQSAITQTRDAAGTAVERLRSAITMLRRSEELEQPPRAPIFALHFTTPFDELIITSHSYRILNWVLPLIFVALSLLVTLTQHAFTSELIQGLLLLDALLLLAYIYTQRARHPLLLQIGLTGQTLAVVALAIMTQALPIMLGLLLVLWQIALRLPLAQIMLFLTTASSLVGLLLVRTQSLALDATSLLIAAVAAVTVLGPLLLARRQLEHRHQAELRAALLASEIEQQTAQNRSLAVAAERSRLAREFHDDLGSRLMLINLQLQLAEELINESSDEALAQLQASRDQLHAAWRSVLAVADAELPLTGANLRNALEDLVAQSRQGTAGEVRLTIHAKVEDLSPPLACTIYRTVQEGLTNAWKHARPTQITIEVLESEAQISVTIWNDTQPGTSISDHEARCGSYGLVGLRERADALRGSCEAGPLAEGGFRLRLVLPVERARHE